MGSATRTIVIGNLDRIAAPAMSEAKKKQTEQEKILEAARLDPTGSLKGSREAQRRTKTRATGRSSTILTSPSGLSGQAVTRKPTILGG